MRWSPFFLVARRGEGDVEAAADDDVEAARGQGPNEEDGDGAGDGEEDGARERRGGARDGDGSGGGRASAGAEEDGDVGSEGGSGSDGDKKPDGGTGSDGGSVSDREGSDGRGEAGGRDRPGEEGSDHDEQVARARRKLQDAIERDQKDRGVTPPPVGQKVDKYFGKKLPPVCAKLGCYLTDDGKRFYCVNPSCQKHKKRETKHTRRSRAPGKKKVFFRCPRCGSRDVDLHMFASQYECKRCEHRWDRD